MQFLTAGRLTLSTERYEDVLQFWFPEQPKPSLATMIRQWKWWFRGGANAEIVERFSDLLEQAIRGEFANWACNPRSRLALILVFDQFSRVIYQGAQSSAQDSAAWALTLEGIDRGHDAALATPWEKPFFCLPLGHSEDLKKLELAIELAEALVQESSPDYRSLLEFSAAQTRRHREVLTRFGRHPHRNQPLERRSTSEELEYLAGGQPVHQRSMPPHLSHLSQSWKCSGSGDGV